MKAHILLTVIPKFQLQIPCTLKGAAENVQVIGIPILIFLRIYIKSSSPVLLTYLCLRREKRKQALYETLQNVSYKSRSSVVSETYTCQNGHILL